MEKITKKDDIETQDLVQERKKSFLEQYLQDFITFQINCHVNSNTWIEFANLTFPIHTFMGYLLVSQHLLAPLAVTLIVFLQNKPAFYHFLQVLIYLFDILLLLSVTVAQTKFKNRIWYSTVNKIIAHYDLLAILGFILTSFFLYIDLWSNLPALIISATAFIFEAVFLENYLQRNQKNYKASVNKALELKIIMILQVILSLFLHRYSNKTMYCLCGASVGGLTLLWFASGGHNLFFHQTPKMALLLLCGTQISAGLLYLLQLKSSQKESQFNLFEFAISLVIVFCFLYLFQVKKRNTFQIPDSYLETGKNIKEYQLALEHLLEESDNSKQKEGLLIGIIYNAVRRCQNHRNKISVEMYDPRSKNKFTCLNMVQEKQCILKFYLKCLFERAIKAHPNSELLIDFAEFGITAFEGINTHCLALEKAEVGSLSFLEYIKVQKLKRLMKQQSKYFNKHVFESRLELDQLLQAQQTYQSIQDDILKFCKGSIAAWQETLQKEIDMEHFRVQLAQNFELLPVIGQKWSSISKEVQAQTSWKRVFLAFNLFLKNIKMKNHQRIDNITTHSSSWSSQEFTPLSFNENSINLDPLLIDKRSIIISCELYNNDLVFHRTSQSFQEVSGFEAEEIKGSSLDMILPSPLKEYHGMMVKKWFEQGYATDERTYKLRESSFLNRYQQELHVLVLYKVYVDLNYNQKMLKFICLMNIKDRIRQEEKTAKAGEDQAEAQVILAEQEEDRVNLSNQANIFLKDQIFEPRPQLAELSAIKVSMRLMTIAVVVLIAVLAVRFNGYLQHIKKHVEGQIIVCNLHQYSMLLSKRYYEILTTPQKLSQMIGFLEQDTAMMKLYESNPLTRQIIFSHYNIPREFPPFSTNSINEGLTYSSIDIFYLVFSCIVTLSSKLAQSSHDFAQLNSYLKPGFDTMMNSTKYELHQELNQDIFESKKEEIIVMAMYAAISILGTFLSWIKLRAHFRKTEGVMHAIVRFNHQQAQKVIAYWCEVGNLFQRLTNHPSKQTLEDWKIKEKSQSFANFEVKDGKEQVSLNSSHKVVIASSKQQAQQCKKAMLLLCFAACCIGVAVVEPTVKLQLAEALSRFQNEGFYLIKDYPITSIISLALSSKTYTQAHPENQPFSVSQFEDTLITLQIMIGQDPLRLETIDKERSLYLQKQDHYLFGNPCKSHPEVLTEQNLPVEQCSSASNRYLTTGIISNLRAILPSLTLYLQGKLSLSTPQLNQMSQSLTISGYYLTDAINTWFDEINSLLASYLSESVLLSLLVCVVLLVLHCGLFQLALLPSLEREYSFAKSTFASYVPAEILATQKITKHQFYQSGVLQLK